MDLVKANKMTSFLIVLISKQLSLLERPVCSVDITSFI